MNTNHNPAITAAIRELKAELKKIACEQKQARQTFRKSTSEWAKKAHPKGPSPASKELTGEWITALHVVYQRLRQSRRRHLKDTVEWYRRDGTYTKEYRRKAYDEVRKKTITLHPETARLLHVQPEVEIVEARHDIPDVSPVVIEMMAGAYSPEARE